MKIFLWDQGHIKSFHECNPHKLVFNYILYYDYRKIPFSIEKIKSIGKLIDGGLPQKCEVWELDL